MSVVALPGESRPGKSKAGDGESSRADRLSEVETTRLRDRLVSAVAEHNVPIDPWMFNGGTVVVLVLTAAAAFIPSLGDRVPAFAASLCSAVAGLVVAMERALGFGARWRYHREMRSAYERIIDRVDFLGAVPDAEKPKYTRDLLAALYAVRTRESAIPNAGNQAPPT